MKIIIFAVMIIFSVLLTSCRKGTDIGIIGGNDGPASIIVSEKGDKKMFEQITPQEAKSIIDSQEDFVVLDVREQEEYDAGHIPQSILMPYTDIESRAEEELPHKDKLILVYCRSGRRSKIAAESLAKLGYTNIKEFGGIIDWPYDI